MDKGELVAVLVTETLPLRLPVVVGVNAPLKLTVCPAAKVTGRARPVILK
jgi:hypothetical protein